MAFRVIDGGLCAGLLHPVGAAVVEAPSRDDVLREAERRIKAMGYERWRNREDLTGIPVPREIGYLALQIGYAAKAIGALADIPADYRSDVYWPA